MKNTEQIIPAFLLNDVRNFARLHPDMNYREASRAFLDKWPGYKASYSIELIENAFKIVNE
jgi:hypothetical protein